jgi:hypothetical protein
MKKLFKEREAFKFYRSYYEVFNLLEDKKDRLDFITAILDKQFEGEDTKLDGMALFAYTSQKHSIDSQVEGFVNYKKRKSADPMGDPLITPTTPPTELPTTPPSYVSNDSVMTTTPPTTPPSLQEEEKEEEKEKEKEEEKVEEQGKEQLEDEDEVLEAFWNKRRFNDL